MSAFFCFACGIGDVALTECVLSILTKFFIRSAPRLYLAVLLSDTAVGAAAVVVAVETAFDDIVDLNIVLLRIVLQCF